MKKVKVIVIDDHDLLREGIIMLLKSEGSVEILGEGANHEELFALLDKKIIPDVLLLDLMMPGKSGIEIAEILHASHPEINIIILSASLEEENIFNAVQAGISGYLPKNIHREELLEAIMQVAGGRDYYSDAISASIFRNYIRFAKAPKTKDDPKKASLSSREIEIISCFAEGLSYKEIGARLFISPRTVESHKNNILSKLELKTRVDIVKFAIREGLIQTLK